MKNLKRMALSFFAVASRNRRLLTPVLIVLLGKIISASWLYHRLSSFGQFRTPWMPELTDPAQSWMYLFYGWDTGWLLGVAQGWYNTPSFFAFFPLYPLIIRVLSLGSDANMLLSALIVSNLFGLAWLPFFQATAEEYMSQEEAYGCTLLTAFFPYVFLYSTVAYTEPIFLFACVASWYFYLKDNVKVSAILSSMATLTRIYGIFITIPIIADSLWRRKWKNLGYLLIPVATLFFWSYYCFINTGNWLAYILETRGLHEVSWRGLRPFSEAYILPFLDGSLGSKFYYWGLDRVFTFILGYIAVASYLSFLTTKVDWRLAFYTSILFITLVFYAPFDSYPRFFSFIFPLWLNLRIKNSVAVTLAIGLSFIFSLMIWYQFLMAAWVA